MPLSDNPILSSDDDLLNRNNFSRLLAKSIIKFSTQDTFTIGLYGKWGSGKTSVVNMMLQQIKDIQNNIEDNNELIIVHFDPWNFSTTNQLLSQFFIRIANQFRSKKDKTLSDIGDAIEEYSELFELASDIPIVGTLISKLGERGLGALGRRLRKGANEKDISKQKEYIIKLIENQKRKILIIIDDIDRLSNEQIRQIFQLITSVAKFPHLIYLLVFDKEIIVKALEKVQEGNGEDYLEKVIQMPIQIPDIQGSELQYVLTSRLSTILSDYNNIHIQQKQWEHIYFNCISPFIKNLRDINRICNNVEFKLAAIEPEVNFADMVAITVMEINNPAIYNWIKNNKSKLTGSIDWNNLSFLKDKTQDEWRNQYKEEFSELLKKDKNSEDIKTIITYLSELFPYFSNRIGKSYYAYNNDELRRNNRIGHSDKFDRYFHLNPDYIDVKHEDVLQIALNSGTEEFVSFMLNEDMQGRSYQYLEEIRAFTPQLSVDRAKVVFKGLYYVAWQLNGRSDYMQLKSDNFAYAIAYEVLDRIPTEERLIFMRNLLDESEVIALQSFVFIINKIEYAYGRYKDGHEHRYNKIITLEELTILESLLLNKLKSTIIPQNIFNIKYWISICAFLEQFDNEYYETLMEKALSYNKNILKYLYKSVNAWVGGGVSYEITNDYQKHLSEEQVINAICICKENGSLFDLTPEIQNTSVAFYLYATDSQKRNEHISDNEVDQTLQTWKSEFENQINN